MMISSFIFNSVISFKLNHHAATKQNDGCRFFWGGMGGGDKEELPPTLKLQALDRRGICPPMCGSTYWICPTKYRCKTMQEILKCSTLLHLFSKRIYV